MVRCRRPPPDRPAFDLNSDPSFRRIPRDATAAELAITHQAYDRRDAVKDLNLVFPLERLRELEAEGMIGRLADVHYGFGLVGSARDLLPSVREVAGLLAAAEVDFALLVPA